MCASERVASAWLRSSAAAVGVTVAMAVAVVVDVAVAVAIDGALCVYGRSLCGVSDWRAGKRKPKKLAQ